MKARVYGLDGSSKGEMELPPVFSTPLRLEVIQKAYVSLESHRFQPKGTHPTAGMDVVARSNDPPTGQGSSRIAKMRGGGGGRQGQAGGVASVRGGRQAHPPKVQKVIRKGINKKENKLALCSAIAATASGALAAARGHRIGSNESFPIIVEDGLESVSTAKELAGVIGALGLAGDVERLRRRKARTGKSALRGRGKKAGKSILLVAVSDKQLSRAAGSLPGVDARAVSDLSVLDLAPGSTVIRLAVFTKGAVEKLAGTSFARMELVVGAA